MFIFQIGKLVENPVEGRMSESSNSLFNKLPEANRKIADKIGMSAYSMMQKYMGGHEKVRVFFDEIGKLNKTCKTSEEWNAGLNALVERMVPKRGTEWLSQAEFYGMIFVVGIPVLAYVSTIKGSEDAVGESGRIIGGFVGKNVPIEEKQTHLRSMFAKCVKKSDENNEPNRVGFDRDFNNWARGGLKYVAEMLGLKEDENEFLRGNRQIGVER